MHGSMSCSAGDGQAGCQGEVVLRGCLTHAELQSGWLPALLLDECLPADLHRTFDAVGQMRGEDGRTVAGLETSKINRRHNQGSIEHDGVRITRPAAVNEPCSAETSQPLGDRELLAEAPSRAR